MVPERSSGEVLGCPSPAKKLLRDFSGCDSLVFAKTTRRPVMAWTEITRLKYQRDGLRYASDTTDEEWALIEPHLPQSSSRGRTRKTSLRDVLDAIYYIAESGCQWRMLPKDFPPISTVQRYFYAWRDDGLWQTDQPCAADGSARGGRTRGQPHRRRDRQPVGQDHRGRRPMRL